MYSELIGILCMVMKPVPYLFLYIVSNLDPTDLSVPTSKKKLIYVQQVC